MLTSIFFKIGNVAQRAFVSLGLLFVTLLAYAGPTSQNVITENDDSEIVTAINTHHFLVVVCASYHSARPNLYAYSSGDPVNRWDPSGLVDIMYDGVVYDVDEENAKLVNGGPSISYTVGGKTIYGNIGKYRPKNGYPTVETYDPVTGIIKYSRDFNKATAEVAKVNAEREVINANNHAKFVAWRDAHGATYQGNGLWGGWRNGFSFVNDGQEHSYYNKYLLFGGGSRGQQAMEQSIGAHQVQRTSIKIVEIGISLPFALESGWSLYSNLKNIESGTFAGRVIAEGAKRPVTAYRVEGAENTRIVIGENGQVVVVNDKKMLFLNFKDRARAEEFFKKRVSQGMTDVQLKSFQVRRSFFDKLRDEAVPEDLAKQFPDRPIEVDVTKASNQFGLRPEQIEELRRAILQGTGASDR